MGRAMAWELVTANKSDKGRVLTLDTDGSGDGLELVSFVPLLHRFEQRRLRPVDLVRLHSFCTFGAPRSDGDFASSINFL